MPPTFQCDHGVVSVKKSVNIMQCKNLVFDLAECAKPLLQIMGVLIGLRIPLQYPITAFSVAM